MKANLEKIRKALKIETREQVQRALDILALDAKEYQKRELFEEEFGLSAFSDELTYLLPDNDNKIATAFAIYLTEIIQ